MERNGTQILRSMNLFQTLAAVIFFMYCTKETWTAEYGIVNEYGKMQYNQRLRFTYLQFHPRTLLECVKECLTRGWRCMSINYSNQMAFCELNYISMTSKVKTENSTSFLYSDIRTWSKDLIGKCRDINCTENEVCSMKTGKCSLSDCGQINFEIPTNTLLQNYGHHSIGNDVDFVCAKGYTMYNKDVTQRVYDGIVRCNDSGVWEDIEFRCIATCKGKLLVIDTNANMKQSSSPLTNMTYMFNCNPGYKAYSKEGKPVTEPIAVKCDQGTGEWDGSEFFCKRPRSMVEDFCPPQYTYDHAANLCYRHYVLNLEMQSAQHVCYGDHAHLLVLTEQNMKLFQMLEVTLKKYGNLLQFLAITNYWHDNSRNHELINFYQLTPSLMKCHFVRFTSPEGQLIFVDGIWLSGTTWKGWGNQRLLYGGTEQWKGLKPDVNKRCIAMNGKLLESVECYRFAEFVCQFELCPESYGYTYDDLTDTCFQGHPANFYTKDMCTPIIIGNVQEHGVSNYYKPSVMSASADNKEFFQVFLNHNDKEFRGRPAYLLSSESRSAISAKKRCTSKKLVIANLQTDENKDALVLMINENEENVIVGLKLSISKTYKYRDSKGASEDWSPQNGPLLETDSKKCLALKNYTYIQTFDCSKESFYICYGKETYTFSDKTHTFLNAANDCLDQRRDLLVFPLSKNQKNALLKEFNLDSKRQYEWYYTGMVLYQRNYIYDWTFGEGELMPDSEQFDKPYPNSYRDEHIFAIFNLRIKKFQLIKKTSKYAYLCQTPEDAAWTYSEVTYDRANAVNLRAYTTAQVNTRNKLPFICEIDTNSIISNLKLFDQKIVYS